MGMIFVFYMTTTMVWTIMDGDDDGDGDDGDDIVVVVVMGTATK